MTERIGADSSADLVLTLTRDWGMEVAEAPIDIEDVVTASRTGALEEMWGSARLP